MTKLFRILPWVALGLLVAVLGGLLLRTGLDRADKISSVVGAIAGVVGVVISAYGIAISRREKKSGGNQQSVKGSAVGGSLIQAIGVKDGIRLGGSPASQLPTNPEAKNGAESEAKKGAEPDDNDMSQTVTSTDVAGHVAQVQDVTGGVEIKDE